MEHVRIHLASSKTDHNTKKNRESVNLENRRLSLNKAFGSASATPSGIGNIGGATSKSTASLYNRRSFTITQLEEDELSGGSQDWGFCKKVFCAFCNKHKRPYNSKQLDEKIVKLHKYCLVHLQDSYKSHLNRLKGVKLLEKMVPRMNMDDVKPNHVIRLVWCSISCMHHFHIRLRGEKGPLEWSRRRQARRAMRSYERLLALLLPTVFATVLQAVITFFNEAQIWDAEYLCSEILVRLFATNDQSEQALAVLLTLIEKSTISDMKTARQITRVLYELLAERQWESFSTELMMRLLRMFGRSIQPDEDEEYNYMPLSRGLEICIRHILENLNNDDLMKFIRLMLEWPSTECQSDDALLEFGNLLEYAAILHSTQSYGDCFTDEVFEQILDLIGSDNLLHSLLGNRVLQQLLDRHNNRMQFDTPRIFFQDTHFNVAVGQYDSNDKYFIRLYREQLHAAILSSVKQHGMHRLHLENVYATIAILVVEVPCGYTAAATVCLAMAIQELGLGDESFQLEETHRLHATVMAVISLVCWVHNAQVFYDYLNSLISMRAQFAPHLNPPLRASYQYAHHHILWNKPELFFEDWEVRYGLWKCFRTRRGRLTVKVPEKTPPASTPPQATATT